MQIVEPLLIVEPIVIERQNYLKVKEHLKYLEEVLQLNQASVERYRFYLPSLQSLAFRASFRR